MFVDLYVDFKFGTVLHLDAHCLAHYQIVMKNDWPQNKIPGFNFMTFENIDPTVWSRKFSIYLGSLKDREENFR